MSDVLIVTAEQLKEGFYVRTVHGQYALEDGSNVTIKRGKFEVVEALKNGTFVVRKPDPVLFLKYDSVYDG